jgi:hypothetical protein
MWRRHRSAPAGPPGPWNPEGRGRKILIEHHDGAVRDVLGRNLEVLGFQVRTCGGPDDPVACPLLEQGACAAVEGADVVVTGLLIDPWGRRVLHAMQQRYPGVSLVAEGPSYLADHLDPRPDQVVFPLRMEPLVAAIGAPNGA